MTDPKDRPRRRTRPKQPNTCRRCGGSRFLQRIAVEPKQGAAGAFHIGKGEIMTCDLCQGTGKATP